MTEYSPICTRLLSKEEIESVLSGLPALLDQLVGSCILSAEYGTECNIHNDLQYHPMAVGIGWLSQFLAESIDQRIYVPAKSELSITTPDRGLEMVFCHEHHIHLSGRDAALIRRASESALIKHLMDKNECATLGH